MPKVKEPQQFFALKLSKAHTAEQGILEMLRTGQKETSDQELAGLFEHHAQETEQHIRNLDQAFEQIGEQPQEVKERIVEALENELKEFKRQDPPPQFIDAFLASGAADTEHHEIACYEGLITMAEQMGQTKIVPLLRENLEQEQHTLQEVTQAWERLASELKQQVPA